MSKSFLSTVVGVALDRGMIRCIDDTVGDYVAPVAPYNRCDDRRRPWLGDPFELAARGGGSFELGAPAVSHTITSPQRMWGGGARRFTLA
jgi:hypothetical protein